MQGITESLRVLSLEARRSRPLLKEAAERATLRLRNFLTRHKPMTSRTVDDALQPLLLTANHKDRADEKLVTIAIGAVQRLVAEAELTTSQLQNVVRVLRIQAEAEGNGGGGGHAGNGAGNSNVQLRVLQTLPLLLSQPAFFNCDDSLMSTVVAITLYLIRSPDVA